MRDCIVSKMVAWLLENNSIMQDEAEIYEFGIKQMLNVCLNVITTISIGVIMGQVLQSIVLMISFMMLRLWHLIMISGSPSSVISNSIFNFLILPFMVFQVNAKYHFSI